MSQSEVAQLRTKIEEEVHAMRQGLSGLAAGNSKHQFIQAKMHRIGQIEDQLATHVGVDEAMLFCCQTYIQVMEESEQITQEEIKKGLTRLNAAWQSLKEAKEDYQRAQEVYKMFYSWLQARASFSLDTTTDFYRLDTNEIGIDERKKENIIDSGRD